MATRTGTLMARQTDSPRAAQLAAALATALALVAPQAGAVDWGADVGVGIIHSSNVDRTPDVDAATVGQVEFNGAMRHNTRTLLVDADLRAEFRKYSESGAESDFLPELRLDALWVPMPGRFSWMVRDNLGQVAQNAQNGLRPVDRENANVFTTGPNFMLPIGDRNRIALSAQYTDVYYSETNLSSKRYVGRFALERETASGAIIALNGVANRTEFKELGGGYDLQGAYLSYSGAGRRTVIMAEAGAEALHDAGETNNGLYLSMSAERRISSRTRLLLQVLERYADAAEIFSLDQALEPELGNVNDLQRTSAPLRQRQVDLRWNYDAQRLSLSVNGGFINEKAQSADARDRRVTEAGINAEWRLTARNSLYGALLGQSQRFRDGTGEESDDFSILVGANYRLRADLELRGQVEHFTHGSTIFDYDETRIALQLVWIPRALERGGPSYYERQRNRSIGRGMRSTGQAPQRRPAT